MSVENGFVRQEGLLSIKSDVALAIDTDAGVVFIPETVAAAGSSTADGTALGSGGSVVSFVTGAGSNKVVTLPASAKPGQVHVIVNTHASNTLEVGPAVGGTVNGASANDLFTVAAASVTIAVAQTPTAWWIGEAPAAV